MQRPRFRVRTLMLLVLLVAVLVGVPLNWMNWLRRGDNGFFSGRVYARLQPNIFVVGETVPVEVEYEFELPSPRPPAGMFFRLKVEMKLEDRKTGAVIDRYTISRHLVSRVREKATGTFRWTIRHPRSGPYYIKYEMSYMDPFGTWTPIGSGASGYTVNAPIADAATPAK
jgi:hypothetical protein